MSSSTSASVWGVAPRDRPGIIKAWDDFHSSEAWDAVYEETYTSTFYDAVARKD